MPSWRPSVKPLYHHAYTLMNAHRFLPQRLPEAPKGLPASNSERKGGPVQGKGRNGRQEALPRLPISQMGSVWSLAFSTAHTSQGSCPCPGCSGRLMSWERRGGWQKQKSRVKPRRLGWNRRSPGCGKWPGDWMLDHTIHLLRPSERHLTQD